MFQLILFGFLSMSPWSSSERAPEPQPVLRIMMLYAHDPKAPGATGFTQELQAVLRAEWPGQFELYEESLDSDRFGSPDNWDQFGAYIENKYRGFRIDAIVAHGSRALQFAVMKFGGVFPDVPFVYGGAFEPVVDFAALPANVTGRRIPLPFAETFTLARSLQPDAKRVVVVAGASDMDSVLAASAVRDITPLLAGLHLDVLRNWSYATLLQDLRAMPKQTIVILSSFRRDWQGQTFNSGDLIPSVTRAAAVPIYGIARNWVGDGIVGGTTMELVSEGRRTGQLLVRVLARPHGTSLPAQEVAVNATVVDWRQLQRWGLSDKRLPPGTEVLYQSPNAWQRYKAAILAILGITAAQSLLIALLMLERRRRIRAQRFVQEQREYEQLLAALRTDAIRHAPDNVSDALEDAVARIGSYSCSSAAELLIYPQLPNEPAETIRWSSERQDSEQFPGFTGTDTVVEMPLLSDDALVGKLKLQGTISFEAQRRLEAATHLLAGALGRARGARALAESRSHVAHIARVATIGQLGAAVTHELRQPLAAIRIHAETGAVLLERDPPDVDEARAVFQDIVHANARAVDVIEHVRMLLRRETGPSTQVDLNEICRRAVNLLQGDANAKRVSILLRTSTGLSCVCGDSVQLQQVLINLGLNAIEAAATSVRERRVEVRTAQSRAGVELEVSDSGPGLPEQTQQYLFQSFFSTKTHGLGMGLAIVQQIVELHHGHVHGENLPGGGARFRVTFPAASATS